MRCTPPAPRAKQRPRLYWPSKPSRAADLRNQERPSDSSTFVPRPSMQHAPTHTPHKFRPCRAPHYISIRPDLRRAENVSCNGAGAEWAWCAGHQRRRQPPHDRVGLIDRSAEMLLRGRCTRRHSRSLSTGVSVLLSEAQIPRASFVSANAGTSVGPTIREGEVVVCHGTDKSPLLVVFSAR